jgi:hypothetical protein
MHKEILSQGQSDLIPLVKVFSREFILVGGTAIALHIGHRKSIDFDLFKTGSLNRKKILDRIKSYNYSCTVTRSVSEQLNVDVNSVKFTFFNYPFVINKSCSFENAIKLPDLLSLSAMKAYAMGRRSKWKDYVDLYFILKNHFSIKEISLKAIEVYGELFSEKLFRAQISYFKDVDYSEDIEFMEGFEVSNKAVQHFLMENATSDL